jgi:ankyrin repeat protein
MKCRPEDYKESFENLVRVCHAIDFQDIVLLQRLLLESGHIECLDYSDDKYLMMCCEPDLFNDFFDLNNVDIDNYVGFMEIPLERAVRKENIELVKIIVNAGQNLPNWSVSLAAGLVAAVEMSNKEIVILLLSRGANPSKSFSEDVPLISAVGHNNIALVELLLSEGAFVDPTCCGSSRTPLILASYYGRLEIVKMLVNAGADVNYLAEGEGALFCAASQGHIDVYEYLLSLVSDAEEIKMAKEELYYKQNNIIREEVWTENECS